VIHNAKEKLSYALGVDLAFRLKWQRVNVDPDLVARGLQDAFADDESRLVIPAKEVAATVKQFQAQRKRGIEHAMEMLSAKNKKAGAAFFAQNAKKDGVMTLPSGLQYKILKDGSGRKPTLDDSVQCHYRGTLLDGTEFDSSYKSSDAPTFPLKRSIKGWQEALQLMPVGSKWELAVPPQLAYGDRGNGMVGPDATLIFEVELISIPEERRTEGAPKPPATMTEGGS
jgi:FKBP-type peptidyl-prolyl cis-trans isomerase